VLLSPRQPRHPAIRFVHHFPPRKHISGLKKSQETLFMMAGKAAGSGPEVVYFSLFNLFSPVFLYHLLSNTFFFQVAKLFDTILVLYTLGLSAPRVSDNVIWSN